MFTKYFSTITFKVQLSSFNSKQILSRMIIDKQNLVSE